MTKWSIVVLLCGIATLGSSHKLGQSHSQATKNKWGFVKNWFRREPEPVDSSKVAYGPYKSKRGTYNLHRVESKKIESVTDAEYGIQIGRANNSKIPDSLKGVFWMQHNPAPEYLASFAKSEWKDGSCNDKGECTGGCKSPYGHDAPHPLQVPPKDDGTPETCGGSLTIKCYDEQTWTWSDNIGGRGMYFGASTSCMELVFFFNKEQTKAHIFPVGCTIIPFPMYFTLEATDDPDNWLRRSHPMGTSHDTFAQFHYNLLRIVDGNGRKTQKWEDYIKSKKVGATSLVAKKESEKVGWGLWG